MRFHIYVSVISAALLGASMSMADVHLESGEQQQIMMELYTSEGCNSCPPAEKYLNNLYKHPKLWKPFIPLAFHVDYWDQLGWRDVYAKPEYSQRQRHYGKTLGARTIYTPEFFVNGREWRSGFYTHLPQIREEVVGNLQVDIQGQLLKAVFMPTQPDLLNTQLNIAMLGMNQHSQIRSGENAGRNTTHQFVVLTHKTVISDNNKWQIELPQLQQNGLSKPQAIVVWVSETGSPAPVQALGGFLFSDDSP